MFPKWIICLILLTLAACTPSRQPEPTSAAATTRLPATPTLAAPLVTPTTEPGPPSPEPLRPTPTDMPLFPPPVEAYSLLLQTYITLPAAAPPPPPIWQPDNSQWGAYVLAAADALNYTQANPELFQAHIRTWGPLSSPDTPAPLTWIYPADLDNDGVTELLVRVPQLINDCNVSPCQPRLICDFGFCPGMVILFELVGALYVPEHIFTGDDFQGFWLDNPELFHLGDLTGDGQNELILTQQFCGAHTCSLVLLVGRWDGQTWHNLVGQTSLGQSSTNITLEDREGNGTVEILLTGGTVGSVGGGLQRVHTLVFALDNGRYELIETIPAPDPHPYYLMMDAYYALQANDLNQAEQLAQQVLAIPTAEMMGFYWMDEWGAVRIPSYAAIELMMVYALRGDQAAIQSLLPTLVQYDTLGNPYVAAALLFADTYNQTGNAAAACQAMATVMQATPEQAQFFEWMGYNTETIPLDAMCPLG